MGLCRLAWAALLGALLGALPGALAWVGTPSRSGAMPALRAEKGSSEEARRRAAMRDDYEGPDQWQQHRKTGRTTRALAEFSDAVAQSKEVGALILAVLALVLWNAGATWE